MDLRGQGLCLFCSPPGMKPGTAHRMLNKCLLDEGMNVRRGRQRALREVKEAKTKKG